MSSRYPTIDEYSLVFLVQKGKRALSSSVAKLVGDCDLVARQGSFYRHWANGAFAVVYKCQEAGKLHALRCMLQRPPASLENRYRAYEAFKAANPQLEFLADAHFYPDGIRVMGDAYPVILMEWVEGDDLLTYVEGCCRAKDSAALTDVLEKWRNLSAQMRQLGIAHGDIQHSNIMVGPRAELKLVDYDSMYLPGMPKETCHIAGCPGYTHPSYFKGAERTSCPEMDALSISIVTLSLAALAHNPGLFGRFSTDNLFFSELDIDDPQSSRAFAYLEGAPDALRSQAKELRKALGGTPSNFVVDLLTSTYEQVVLPMPTWQHTDVPYVPGQPWSTEVTPVNEAYIPSDPFGGRQNGGQ